MVLFRADDWNVNKWVWEGSLKVVSKGEECIIKLEDKNTGELYARAFLRKGEPHPVEPVIDSSRYFVLRIEENIGGRLRHAFIGIGFRERPEAYDFQAALHDHMNALFCCGNMKCLSVCSSFTHRYLDKKQTAEEMEQHFQSTPSVDYSLKEGETLVLQIKNKGNHSSKSTISEQDLGNISLEESSKTKLAAVPLKPPPPPQAAVSPVNAIQMSNSTVQLKEPFSGDKSEIATVEDDFGDFQTAG
ncbi:hypothetical protein Taro_010824 [Colocasia esculenta]|uniref:NECAP PHear domain-containing protein n=1 Tax=Colocasia esculenta TaxID=4460 RepID=A0A843U474_COLES|nr:hypothetical protein [Colocasia esculenta]